MKNPKLTNRKISGKFPKYLKINYFLCLKNQHLHFITTSIQIQKVLEDTTISDKTQARLQEIKQDYNDIGSQHSNDIGVTCLEEMTIKTDPDLPPVASKP